MSKITLSEIVCDYITDSKKTIANYGNRTFANKCGLSRNYIWKLTRGDYGDKFSSKTIEGIAKGLEMQPDMLRMFLDADDGYEMYYRRKELLKALNNSAKNLNNDQLEVYIQLMNNKDKLK